MVGPSPTPTPSPYPLPTNHPQLPIAGKGGSRHPDVTKGGEGTRHDATIVTEHWEGSVGCGMFRTCLVVLGNMIRGKKETKGTLSPPP